MIIVETSVFTRQVSAMLSMEAYRRLQITLVRNPEFGNVIRGSGGLRKMRWSSPGRGKRGGVRVIYYWAVAGERILLLFMYPKGERDDLSAGQIKVLRKIVEEEYP
jgi:mRNA-degrading endonuclease RelE of RelBE toxin-antitoxin system